ncbi:hypothetical protein NX059_007471 [Plenodomus lindquistii]|nr:hypothetical protein NX059_007471 [Plenodomus lindquistii]
MYRRSDPRWNRTLQHISDNLEHANESAQENLYGFTQRFISPCLASVAQCAHTCTAPCFPTHNDRRRHRGRSQGRAESSFDFYDDWDNDDESDGLLGWGSDNLDRFLGGASTYGTTTQPARQSPMGYGQRSRDTRYSTPRRKSTALPREAGPDPTIIPSSSYFGFLGRLPWRIGGKGLRYKPSAADLTDHPGAIRTARAEDQPLMEVSDNDDDAAAAGHGAEAKRHRRQRSDTRTSGHTTDSLSSRGDIFPSEDELEDAVPLDDEFTVALERRTTSQWNEDSSSKSKSKRPSASRVSTQTASSRTTHDSSRHSTEGKATRHTTPQAIDETPSLETLEQEEECVRMREETDVQRRRHDAHQLALKRGLVPEPPPRTPSTKSRSSQVPSPQLPFQMVTVHSTVTPLLRLPANELITTVDAIPVPTFFDAQTLPESSSFFMDKSDYSSGVLTPNRSSSINESARDGVSAVAEDHDFVPARLPHFGARPD